MALLDLSQTKIVTVDGPISVGKTTLGERLQAALGKRTVFYPECGHKAPPGRKNPIDVWLKHKQDLGGVFQMLMYAQCQSRMDQAVLSARIADAEKTTRLVLIDRSLVGNAVFAVTNFMLGNMTRKEFRFYCANLHCDPIMTLQSSGPNVQLWATVDTCVERLKTRSVTDTTDEEKSYPVDYFWDLARTTFCALLSNLSSAKPHPQLVLAWDGDADAGVRNFVAVYNAFMSEPEGTIPLAVRLSYNACPEEDEDAYMNIFNCTDMDDFFSRQNIVNIMDAISLRGAYTGPQRVFIQLPRTVSSTPFTKVFPLTIY